MRDNVTDNQQKPTNNQQPPGWRVEHKTMPNFTLKDRLRILWRTITYLPNRVWKLMRHRKAVAYLYGNGVHRHPAFWLVAIVMIFGAGLWTINHYQQTRADSDTQTVRPDADFGTTNNFAVTSGTINSSCSGHCDYVDESDDNTYLGTGTGMDSTTAEEEFDFGDIAVPSGGTLDQVTQVQVTVRAGIATLAGDADGIQVRLFIDGAYDGTTESTTLTTSTTDHTFTWSGLSASTASDLRVEVVRAANGGGSPAGRDDDVRVYEVKADVTFDYTPPAEPPPFLTMDGYAFTNDDGIVFSSNNSGGHLPNIATGTLWSGADNIKSDDGVMATQGVSALNSSGNLDGTDYGFSIPGDATITGIEVAINKCQTGAFAANLRDLTVRIFKGGVLTNDNKADIDTNWSSDCDTVAVYGGDNDLWNDTWTPGDINASDFGVRLNVRNTDSVSSKTAEVDHITVTVYYDSLVTDPDEASVQAGSEFTSGKTLTQVRQGERVGLRMHVTNEGGALSDDTNLSLFYDKNDGVWTKVENSQIQAVGIGNCGYENSDFNCAVLDATGMPDQYSSIAVDEKGMPWLSYFDRGTFDLRVAWYVGKGGDCDTVNGTDEWDCTTVDSTSTVMGQNNSLGISPTGEKWISYYDQDNGALKVARFVGSGGSGCSNAAWMCTTVDTSGDTGWRSSLAFNSSGQPWISYRETDNDDLLIAQYVGSGGSGCSDSAWTCTTIDSTSSVSGTSLTIDYDNKAWIAYYDSVSGDLMVAEPVGTGGSGCDDSGWTCSIIESTGSLTSNPSITVDSTGTPWISYVDATNSDLKVAKYMGTGLENSCTSGSSDWECVAVDTNGNIEDDTGIAVDASDNVWVAYHDDFNSSLRIARHVGSGGSGCATDSWASCDVVDNSGNSGNYPSLAFDYRGNAWLTHIRGASTLMWANIERSGEITISPSEFSSTDDSISESFADMTSSSDATNHNDGDCLNVGASWNNGIFFKAENGSGMTIPNGESTAQCTEIAWMLDTSQAVPGTTYRFIVTTEDSIRPDKNPWRGPASIASGAFPTLTIANEDQSTYRYSKDVLAALSDSCASFQGTLGASDWSCERLAVGDDIFDMETISAAISPGGEPWITFYNNESGGDELVVAQYIQSGGNCDAFDATGGSDAWNCTVVIGHDNPEEGDYAKIEFDNNGTPWIAFRNDEGSSNDELAVAKYVGSGGNCQDWDGTGGSNAWQCTTIFQGSQNNDVDWLDMAMSPQGDPWISFKNEEGTNDELTVARYVGSGGNCEGYDNSGGSSEWQCEAVVIGDDSGDGDHSKIGFDHDGTPWIAFHNIEGTNGGLAVARYVGSNGSCATFETAGGSNAWDCTQVVENADDGTGQFTSIAFDQDGDPWVSFSFVVTGEDDMVVAEYVGSGGNCDTFASSGSAAWNCTAVIDGASGNDGDNTTIAFDYNGDAWASFYVHDNRDLMIARYVGSGGDCDTIGNGGGSTAWECITVLDGDTSSDGYISDLVFDQSGVMWLPHLEVDNGSGNRSLSLAKTYMPHSKPGELAINTNHSPSAKTGDLRYYLSAGLAPNTNSYGDCVSTTGDLNGYCGLYHPDGYLDSIAAHAGERPMYAFSTKVDSNSILPTASLYFRTDVSPSTNNVVLQVYRFGSTNAWETVETYSTAGCTGNENCIIKTTPSGTASEYFESDGSDYWVHYRVYQEESDASGITFSIDSFTAKQPQKLMRGGRAFRELRTEPLGW